MESTINRINLPETDTQDVSRLNSAVEEAARSKSCMDTPGKTKKANKPIQTIELVIPFTDAHQYEEEPDSD